MIGLLGWLGGVEPTITFLDFPSYKEGDYKGGTYSTSFLVEGDASMKSSRESSDIIKRFNMRGSCWVHQNVDRGWDFLLSRWGGLKQKMTLNYLNWHNSSELKMKCYWNFKFHA